MIEQDIFKKCQFDNNKLISYGFIKDKCFKYETLIFNGFKVVITITNGIVTGKIYDPSFDNEEYTAFRRKDATGTFVGTVREEYEKILKDIKKKCTKEKQFEYDQSNRLTAKIKEIYNDDPIFKWEDESAVFENKYNHKWYGLLTPVNKTKLGLEDKIVEILNIKLDPNEIEELLKKEGFFKAYHMNKKYWITILLDDTLSDEEILFLLDKSYNLVKPKK